MVWRWWLLFKRTVWTRSCVLYRKYYLWETNDSLRWGAVSGTVRRSAVFNCKCAAVHNPVTAPRPNCVSSIDLTCSRKFLTSQLLDPLIFSFLTAVSKRVNFNIFHLLCINQIHNIKLSNKMHFNFYDVFYSKCFQHVSAGIAVIFRVISSQ